MFQQAAAYLFFLTIVLVIFAYFTGFVSDTQSFSNAGVSIIDAATGRNSSGGFGAYPSTGG